MLAFVINFQLWPLPTLSLSWVLNVDMMLNSEAATFAPSRKGQGTSNPGTDADGALCQHQELLVSIFPFMGEKYIAVL